MGILYIKTEKQKNYTVENKHIYAHRVGNTCNRVIASCLSNPSRPRKEVMDLGYFVHILELLTPSVRLANILRRDKGGGTHSADIFSCLLFEGTAVLDCF